MAKILVKCIEEVVHGAYNLSVGQKAMMDEHLAKELERFVVPDAAAPVDEKAMTGAELNKMVKDSGWKDKAEGSEQAESDSNAATLPGASEASEASAPSTPSSDPAPTDLTQGNASHLPAESLASEQVTSSASPAAQASPQPTVTPLKTGATKKKGGR